MVYGVFLWLPLYLETENGYTDIQTATIVSMFDYGNIAGALSIGFSTDKMYGRRLPLIMVAIVSAVII